MATQQRVIVGGRTPSRGAGGRDSAPERADAALPTRKRNRLGAVLAVMAALALAAAAYLYGTGKGAAPEPTAEEHEPVVLGEVMTVEPVSLNLAGGRYLRLGIALQLTADVHGEIDSARALDAAIALFSGRDIAQVSDPAVRDQLKAELAHQLTETYHGDVVDVYLTEYVTQ